MFACVKTLCKLNATESGFCFFSYTSVISEIVVLEQTTILCLAQALVVNSNCYFDSCATFNKVFHMKLYAFCQLNLHLLF